MAHHTAVYDILRDGVKLEADGTSELDVPVRAQHGEQQPPCWAQLHNLAAPKAYRAVVETARAISGYVVVRL